jgi:hypothetical protein
MDALWHPEAARRECRDDAHRQNGEMPTDLAELSSLTSSLDQITLRVGAMAEHANAGGEDTVSAELFSVERALQGATRRLQRLLGNSSSRGG